MIPNMKNGGYQGVAPLTRSREKPLVCLKTTQRQFKLPNKWRLPCLGSPRCPWQPMIASTVLTDFPVNYLHFPNSYLQISLFLSIFRIYVYLYSYFTCLGSFFISKTKISYTIQKQNHCFVAKTWLLLIDYLALDLLLI